MKETTNIQRSIQYLYKIFNALNDEYFNSELPRPIISIASTPKAFGHFTPWNAYRIHRDDGTIEGNVEINIGAGTLDRDILSVCVTLQHELVHYYCYLHQIKDTSNNGRYHNSRGFKAEAEKRGLVLSYAPTIGWSISEASDQFLDFIIACGFEDFRIGRNEFTSYRITGTGTHNTTGTTPTTPKGNSHKLICPCCGTIIRFTTKKVPNILCIDCNQKMIEA